MKNEQESLYQNLDKKYIFMRNDPKKGPNPSKRGEILAEGFGELC